MISTKYANNAILKFMNISKELFRKSQLIENTMKKQAACSGEELMTVQLGKLYSAKTFT